MQTEISDPTGRSNEKDSRKIEQWALAAVLRIFRLGQLPNGFSPDEASYGYNGYSLLHTGRDRFGEWLPLFADNFGDLIAASYMWLTVPSIALFGLDEFAVRLPAALVGIVTVWVAYKLGAAFYDAWAGLLTALFLAISPWHIQVSRYAERSPLLPLVFCLGLFLFLRWQQKQKKELLWSALAFALCLYSYASARVFVPLYVLGAALIYSSYLCSHTPPRTSGNIHLCPARSPRRLSLDQRSRYGTRPLPPALGTVGMAAKLLLLLQSELSLLQR
jgi:4-amino-4-deoxy-L-arabinose transferase-like glycosyltransferase